MIDMFDDIYGASIDNVEYEQSVWCPVCGAEDPEELYIDKNSSDIIGCSDCLKAVDAYDWIMTHGDTGEE